MASLAETRPCRVPGLQELEVAGNTQEAPASFLLKDPQTGVVLVLEPWERDLWRELDGTRNLRELVPAALLLPEPIGPDRIGRALTRFGRAGFLGPEFRAHEMPREKTLVVLPVPTPGPAGRKLAG